MFWGTCNNFCSDYSNFYFHWYLWRFLFNYILASIGCHWFSWWMLDRILVLCLYVLMAWITDFFSYSVHLFGFFFLSNFCWVEKEFSRLLAYWLSIQCLDDAFDGWENVEIKTCHGTDWHQTCDLPASASQLLGLQVCVTMPGLQRDSLLKKKKTTWTLVININSLEFFTFLVWVFFEELLLCNFSKSAWPKGVFK